MFGFGVQLGSFLRGKAGRRVLTLNGRRIGLRAPPLTRLAVAGGGLVGLQLLTADSKSALCQEADKAKEGATGGSSGAAGMPAPGSGDEAMSAALQAVGPIVGKLGFGGVMGWTAGYAAKKIGKAAAFGTGCLFILFQGMAYAGFIEIKWGAIEEKVEAAMDLDGDGKVDAKDAMVAWTKYIKPMLTHGLPSAGSFTLGFLGGVKYG
mmetsp:Transcript_14128/g.21300  ORF Transcript_14128/g.21300 Transcript_14128/m.21300 type:complete len:207 (-) Transcript_14128:78-698(-)